MGKTTEFTHSLISSKLLLTTSLKTEEGRVSVDSYVHTVCRVEQETELFIKEMASSKADPYTYKRSQKQSTNNNCYMREIQLVLYIYHSSKYSQWS